VEQTYRLGGDGSTPARACPGRGATLPQGRSGVDLLENMKLDELAQKQVYEFAFMMRRPEAAFALPASGER
ncbi:MAG TPA: hypothetical protein VJT13_18820, partial [Xanthobacteraceae bacterium]|nr:hypothetical protein [Xanthobacteraceae bacterium]